MANPTIYVNLSSVAVGTIPTVTETVKVKDGGKLDVSVTWPVSATDGDVINCDLKFIGKNKHNPFIGGSDNAPITAFSLNRALNSATSPGVTTLKIKQNAIVTTDTYMLILKLDGQTYVKDPTIKVSGGNG